MDFPCLLTKLLEQTDPVQYLTDVFNHCGCILSTLNIIPQVQMSLESAMESSVQLWVRSWTGSLHRQSKDEKEGQANSGSCWEVLHLNAGGLGRG
jgi:hypothetical protein